MRFRALLILALGLGVFLLVYVMGRKSARTSESIPVSQGISRPAAANNFKRHANEFIGAGHAEAGPTESISNLIERLMDGELTLQLTPEQLADYLRQYGTNVETLLATQDTNYIKLAAEMFPGDPRVQFAVLGRDLFPEARREWLDRFKQSAPDNSMADYLSAREYFKAGDREQALKDLAAAASKPRFNDYALEQVQNMEDAQLSAGRSLVEAKVAAGSELLMPQFAMFKGLAQEVQKMQKEYLNAGDPASAEDLAQMGHVLAQQLTAGEGSRTLIGQLVGLAIDRIVLNSLPLDAQPGFLNGTVQQRIDELTALRQNIKSLTVEFGGLMGGASETEIISYFDRMKLQGETKAILWLQHRNHLR